MIEAAELGRRGELRYKQYDARTMSRATYRDNEGEDDTPPWERRDDGETTKQD